MADIAHRWIMGEFDYVICLFPIRHGKSQTFTIDATSWGIGKFPNWDWMVASYSDELATSFGRKIIGNIKSQKYKNLFPNIRLSPVSHAVGEFQLDYPYRGTFVASGRGGGQTGKGWTRGICDDPTKNWEEAMSPSFREKSWDWFRSTFWTRSQPGEGDEGQYPALMIPMTHWHEDDIAGRCIKEFGTIEDGGTFHVIRCPAIAEEEPEDPDERKRYFQIAVGRDYTLKKYPGGWRKKDDALWPERFPYDIPERPNAGNALKNMAKNYGSKIWPALGQQRPTMEQGNEIKRTWFNLRWRGYNELPPIKYLWGEIDTSLKPSIHHDRSAFLICALAENGLVYGIKGVAGHMTGDEIKKTIISLQDEMDRMFPSNNEEIPFLLKGQYIEDTAIAVATLQDLRNNYNVRLYPAPVHRVSKLADVRNAAIFCERGFFVPPANESWWDETFFPEILAYGPSGSSTGLDDCTDVFVRAILRVMGKVRQPKEDKPNIQGRKFRDKVTGY